MNSWGESREESLRPQTVGWPSGKSSSLVGTWQVGSGKEAELPEEEQSKHHCTWMTAAGKGHRVIPDTVGTTSTGSKINFKPHWMVALIFFSVFCLAYGVRLSFVPERRWREGSCKQKSKMNRTSWLKSHTRC